MTDGPLRMCVDCLVLKDLSSFHKTHNKYPRRFCVACGRTRALKHRRQRAGSVSVAEKRCSRCDILSPSTAFYKDCTAVDGLYSYCKACAAAKDAKVRKDHLVQYKKKDRSKARIKKYGMKVSEFEEMAVAQDNICLICQRPERRQQEGHLCSLSVDHCHKTGRIRGLLCKNCNSALGLLYENPLSVLRMLVYIRHNCEQADLDKIVLIEAASQ